MILKAANSALCSGCIGAWGHGWPILQGQFLFLCSSKGSAKGFLDKLLPCSNPHNHKNILREKLRICNQLLFLWWGLVVNVHTLFKVCSAALGAVLPFSYVTLLAPHWCYNFLFENKAKNWCPLGALIVWDAKVGANYAEYGMLISAQLNAFSFSAFSLLAPFFFYWAPFGAWRMVSRLREVRKCVFASGKQLTKTFHPKIGLYRKNIWFSTKNHVFRKISCFPVEICDFASVSARKFLLKHFSL